MLAWCFMLSSLEFVYATRPCSENVEFRGWRRKTGFSPPVKYFTDRSKAVLVLWIFYGFYLSCVCLVFVRIYLYVLCGHLLGKG